MYSFCIIVMTGRRESIQFSTGFGISLLCRPAMTGSLMGLGFERAFGSADFDFRVGLERIWRQSQIQRRRTFADTAGGVVLAAVTRTEPAPPVASHIRRLVAEWNAAEMGADADQNDPL